MAESVTISRASAVGWVQDLLLALGAGEAAARLVCRHLIGAEDAGHSSHGLRMLDSIATAVQRGYIDPAAEPAPAPSVGATVRIDGRRGLGHPTASLATDEAVALARTYGCGLAAVRGSGHMGRLAPYAEAAAESGCVLCIFATDAGANQHVAPAGGRQGRLSTNPLAFGIPRTARPHLVVDMATSAYAHGTLADLADRGIPIPADALVEDGGEVMRPMAGHKGFGLALVVEALGGGLSGAGMVGECPPEEAFALQGALFVAVDVAALRPLPEFVLELESSIEWIRSAEPVLTDHPVRVPGESAAAKPLGSITLPDPVWASLADLSRRLQVKCPPRKRSQNVESRPQPRDRLHP